MRKSGAIKVSISGARSELGYVLRQLSPPRGNRSVQLNLTTQHPNTLLHDGHAWEKFARTAPAATRAAIRAARTGRARLLVHASFAFVHAVERGAELDPPLRSCADAILECEALVLSAPMPACVVRLGYLYGPHSTDLRAYRTAFRLGRPYWSGPAQARQYHLHQLDAASALLAAAKSGTSGKVYYATDGRAVSFMRFMDAFAHRVGRPKPLHLPLYSQPLARLIIRKEHMQQTALPMPLRGPGPRVPGWHPKFVDYRKGLDQVIGAWRDESSPRSDE